MMFFQILNFFFCEIEQQHNVLSPSVVLITFHLPSMNPTFTTLFFTSSLMLALVFLPTAEQSVADRFIQIWQYNPDNFLNKFFKAFSHKGSVIITTII